MAAGLFYLLTFVSIPTLALYSSVRGPNFVVGPGFIGAVLLVASWFGILLGFVAALSPVTAVTALPIALWEFSLGIYLTLWGFKVSPITPDV